MSLIEQVKDGSVTMHEPEDLPVDESQDLVEGTDDRDRGYGVVIEEDQVGQHEPPDDDLDQS